MAHREVIVGALTEIFAREPIAAWQERLRPVGVPCNPVLAIDQVARDEQVRARDMIVEIDDPDIGKLQMAGVPIKFSDARGGVRTRAAAARATLQKDSGNARLYHARCGASDC